MKDIVKAHICHGLFGLMMAGLWAGQGEAREPGVLPASPPGASIGVPIAAPTPFNGIFVSSRSGLSFQTFYDANGNETPTELTIRDTVLQFGFVPGNELFGGQYRAFLSIPFIDVEGENLPTPFGPVDAGRSGLGSIELRPIDISWQVSPGIFVNAGVSALSPGKWDATELVNPGQNFWSIAPSVGISYMRDGWNATGHLQYVKNFENKSNGYKSGDDINLNLTLMKDVGNNLSVGAVGYWQQQVTNDENPSGAYGGLVSGRAKSAGLGLSVTKQLGPINLNVMYTKSVMAENTAAGDRLWFNVAIPLQVFGK